MQVKVITVELSLKTRLIVRGRSDLSWKVERTSGDILNLDSQARKLKIELSPDTTGVYQCFSVGKLVHSFKVRVRGEDI